MSTDLLRIGPITAVYTTTGRRSGYRQEINHTGLNEYRLIHGPDEYILKNKLATQIASWDQKWHRLKSKQARVDELVASKSRADEMNRDAESAIEEARTLLAAALKRKHTINWASLKDKRHFVFRDTGGFPRVRFDAGGAPTQVIHDPLPSEPDPTQFAPRFTLLQRLVAPLRRGPERLANARLEKARESWRTESRQVGALNAASDVQMERSRKAYAEKKEEFLREQEASNQQIDDLKARYLSGDGSAVESVSELILTSSKYPEWVTKDFKASYLVESKLLIIDYKMPRLEDIPDVAKITFVASSSQLRQHMLPDAEKGRLFDSALYQISLRSLHEIFEGDEAKHIQAIVFNGWLTWVNKGSGTEETGCLLSVQASREDLAHRDLSKVDPKACFKDLKGVAAAKLSGITPIAPIVKMNMDDRRFVASYEVASSLTEGINLAMIDWEDFEHLVRELFEREYSADGSEVKVTRVSADGGVDAVVFDPDPIRGGKIVIQAKRYTNTVGVSAVRDLYGTMLNEGAMKGILITTSDYGNDSYSFAKDKPITLLNGANLLQMLGKQGVKARIDLAEARRVREAS